MITFIARGATGPNRGSVGDQPTEGDYQGEGPLIRGIGRGDDSPLAHLTRARCPCQVIATAERSEGTILTRRAETSEAQALFMSSAAVAINFNGSAQKKSKGRVLNIPRTKDQAARTHDLVPRAQDTGAARCHGTQCSGVTVDSRPRYCAHIERGGPPF